MLSPNKSFQRVFERLEELNIEYILVSKARPSHARGGERKRRERTIQWKPISDFVLQDESTDEEILKVEALELSDEEDEGLAENVILGLQAHTEQPLHVLFEAERMKWFSVSWPSSLAEVFR